MSTPIKVWSLLYYLTEVEGIVWRQDDWDTNKIIKAVKGEPINGYFQFKIGGQKKKFDQLNVSEFMPVLFCAVAKKLGKLLSGKFDLVPIPNSSATIKDEADFKTWAHARAVAEAIGSRAAVVPALRWKQVKDRAHDGGTRDPQIHFENLCVAQKPTNPVVLFDDVLTTGGQMIASYRRLAESRVMPVLGIVIGRATKEQKEPAIGWHEEKIETEEMPANWNALLTSKP